MILSFNFLIYRIGFITNGLVLLWEWDEMSKTKPWPPPCLVCGSDSLRSTVFLLWEKTVSYFVFESTYLVLPDFEMSGTNNIPSCLLISWDKVHRLGDSSHRHLLSHSSGGQRSEIRRAQAGSLWGPWGKDPVHVSPPAAGSLRHSLPWRRLSLGVFPLSSLYTCLHVSKLPLFTKTQTLWVRTHPNDCIFIWLLLQRPHFQRR